MARRRTSAQKLTLISFFVVVVSTVFATATEPPASNPAQTPLSDEPSVHDESNARTSDVAEAHKAYSQAQRLLRQISSIPASQVTPFFTEPVVSSPPALLKALFPNENGPFATAIRIAYRLRNQSWFPPWISRRFGGRAGRRREETKSKAVKLIDLLEHAVGLGHQDAQYTLADISMFPPPALPMNATRAFKLFSAHAEQTGNATSQQILGFLYATGYGGAVDVDQPQALLHYTFAALAGSQRAEMVMGYRNWAGIGMQEDCLAALGWYESAAEKALSRYLSGPPGGRTLPPTVTRLSDLEGGVYGPGASVASTGTNSLKSVIKAATSRAAGETWEDVLEYYQYHADRGEIDFSYRLGKIYYHGSVYAALGGASSGAEGVGWIGRRDYHKARTYFVSITRLVWPVNSINFPLSNKKEVVEERVGLTAAMAAGFLGRMYLRGEGVKKDVKVARMWFERGAEYADRESHLGLGYIWRDGLLDDGKVDLAKAITHFTAAAEQDLADAQVQLGKYHYEMGDYTKATKFFETAIRHGSPFEPYYYIAEMQSNIAHDTQTPSSLRSGACGVAVSFYKLVAERGSWDDDLIGDAERLWDLTGVRNKARIGYGSAAASVASMSTSTGVSGAVREAEKEAAKLRWWIAAEAGMEVAQNNIAYLFDQDRSALRHTRFTPPPSNDTARLALTQWIRSASQRNVDALVKVGDYYYHGLGVSDEPQHSRWEKAAGYYHTAVESQVSALAMWNLGWMYENGVGVAQDFHLAKRYYDLALETNRSEAYFPVLLSLAKLYLRSLWYTIMGGTETHLTLWTYAGEDTHDHWYWGRAGEEFKKRWAATYGRSIDNGDARTAGVAKDESGGYIDNDDDPVQWARDRKREELEKAQAEHDADGGLGPEDYFDGATGRPGSRELFDRDDTLDDLIFMVMLCGVLGALIFLRMRYIAGYEEQQRQEEAARAGQAQQPPQ